MFGQQYIFEAIYGKKTQKTNNHLAVSGVDEFQEFSVWFDRVQYLCSWPCLQQQHLPQLSAETMGQDEVLLYLAQTASPGCKQLAISIVKTDTRWEGNRWKVEMACPSSQQVWVRNRSQASTSTQDLLHNFQTHPDNWFYYKKKSGCSGVNAFCFMKTGGKKKFKKSSSAVNQQGQTHWWCYFNAHI